MRLLFEIYPNTETVKAIGNAKGITIDELFKQMTVTKITRDTKAQTTTLRIEVIET